MNKVSGFEKNDPYLFWNQLSEKDSLSAKSIEITEDHLKREFGDDFQCANGTS